MYATILALLFASVVVNLATNWQFLRRAMIVHDDNWAIRFEDEYEIHIGTGILLDSSSRIAILLADVILVSWKSE